MFDRATAEFLESGNALIVGTVTPDGAPCATRGWGLTVLPGEPRTVRLLVPADDPMTLANIDGGGAIAITGADVQTLRSMQLKGRVTAVEPATDDDHARAERFADEFFAAIHDTDGTALALVERMQPYDYVACTVVVDDLYDQTPGPAAGGRLTTTP